MFIEITCIILAVATVGYDIYTAYCAAASSSEKTQTASAIRRALGPSSATIRSEADACTWIHIGSDGETEYRMMDALTFKTSEQLEEHVRGFAEAIWPVIEGEDGEEIPGFGLRCESKESLWLTTRELSIRISKLASAGWHVCFDGEYSHGLETPERCLLYVVDCLEFRHSLLLTCLAQMDQSIKRWFWP